MFVRPISQPFGSWNFLLMTKNKSIKRFTENQILCITFIFEGGMWLWDIASNKCIVAAVDVWSVPWLHDNCKSVPLSKLPLSSWTAM